jgi:BolA protein
MTLRSGPTGVNAHDIESALREALQPTTLTITDDSHLHAGHAGAREGRHFSVRITSARFVGMGRVARHRLVYDALHRLIPQGVHALAIQARSPDEPDELGRAG